MAKSNYFHRKQYLFGNIHPKDRITPDQKLFEVVKDCKSTFLFVRCCSLDVQFFGVTSNYLKCFRIREEDNVRETNFRKVKFSIVSLPNKGRSAKNNRKEKGIIAFLFLFLCLFVFKGHIRYSPQVPICSDHIFGNCNHGNKCDNHHCPLPYHWQYRPSLDGWKSFSAQDNCRMEELFCEPSKDVVNASEIEAVFESYRRERSVLYRRIYFSYTNRVRSIPCYPCII